jgi:hypothetical protein
MARVIDGSQAIAAGATVNQLTALNESTFNPVAQHSRVQVFASEPNADLRVRVTLGADVHGEELVPAVSATLSTRDHLIAEGVVFRGQKITIGVRNTDAVNPATLTYRVVINPA